MSRAAQYDYHVKTYGHPSQFGYKDICNIWRAENWNPEELIRLYAKTGAKYFVALANHHGNFDCWNSKYQPWNSVNVGPKKDIVGTWEKVARAQGLRFGITFHGTPGRVWREFMPVRYGSDETGPLKGVPYDGMLTKADGKGKWWEGMDPRQFNGRPHDKNDPCPEFVEKFMLRVQDLIDQYNPDLLYFDDNCDWDFDAGAPSGRELKVWLGMPELTPPIMAYYYNANMRRNAGKLDAVFNIKNVPPAVWSTLVRDFEMSQAQGPQPAPWQTDACIGGWHYSRSILKITNTGRRSPWCIFSAMWSARTAICCSIFRYPATADLTIRNLRFSISSATGCGSTARPFTSTRPWKIDGEGPTKGAGAKAYSELPTYVPGDIRFTTKGDTLYAIALRGRRREIGNQIARFEFALFRRNRQNRTAWVSEPNLEWSRSPEGVTVKLPQKPPCEYAWVFRINS